MGEEEFQNSEIIAWKILEFWQAFFEIVSYGLHYYVKQECAKYRPLMYPNLDLKTLTLLLSLSYLLAYKYQ